MSSTLTVSDLLAYISSSTGSGLTLAATPDSASLDLIQRTLDAAIAYIENEYAIPEVYPVEVEHAVLMLAARLWERRKSPTGIATIDDYGAVRVGGFSDGDVDRLLAGYKRPRFA